MTREEAVSIIEERIWVTEYVDSSYVDCVDIEALRIAIKALEQTEPHWIPCSERLPYAEYGESDSVLCCTESGLQIVLYYNGGIWCYPSGETYIWCNHENGWHNKVIAWMPLPEPYRGENDE